MHSFLKAIGFRNVKERRDVEALLNEVCAECDTRNAVRVDQGRAFVEYWKEYAPGCGLVVCGEMDEEGFHQDYYFPYFKTDTLSSYADLSIEKHSDKEAFAGSCEDNRLGTSLIFYLLNAAKYRREYHRVNINGQEISTSLTGLASEGKILFPVQKKPNQALLDREATKKRVRLIAAARKGDEEAIESLTLEDMDNYNMVSRRIMTEDVFSIVDTFFMPYGMECDHYQIMGEIQSWRKVQNSKTKEQIYQMQILCNDIMMDVCIHEADLLGDPDIGRRFKGIVWLQGNINYPDM
ncbi:MAG: DUF3881 family protein [Lachnospiraceae bacterium]|nr:DUF3881 family protein [Lachnospiraceae bacterium]